MDDVLLDDKNCPLKGTPNFLTCSLTNIAACGCPYRELCARMREDMERFNKQLVTKDTESKS